jgi:hypothetical protein
MAGDQFTQIADGLFREQLGNITTEVEPVMSAPG